MKKAIALGLALATAVPFAASAQRLSEAKLLEIARAENTCKGGTPVSAKYASDDLKSGNANNVVVECRYDGAVLSGGLGKNALPLLLLLPLAALGGGSNSTGTTSSTRTP